MSRQMSQSPVGNTSTSLHVELLLFECPLYLLHLEMADSSLSAVVAPCSPTSHSPSDVPLQLRFKKSGTVPDKNPLFGSQKETEVLYIPAAPALCLCAGQG